MRLDHILLESLIEHARRGAVESAQRILEMRDKYISIGSPIPDILSVYLAEAAKEIDEGIAHNKAFNLSRRPGNQYSGDTDLKEINIARYVYGIQEYLKSRCKIKPEYLMLYITPSDKAIEHLETNFNPTIDEICDWLSDHKLIPHITSRSAKNSKNRKYMRADNIRKIYDRWIEGIKATEPK